jgi:phosphate transport system protein
MSLIETEILKLQARARQVITILQKRLELFEQAVLAKDWARLREVRQYKVEALTQDMRLDRRCTRILALHQPVAQDLRLVLAVFRMHFYITEIADRLEALGERLAEHLPNLPPEKLEQVPFFDLVQHVRQLLDACLEAFFQADMHRAKLIPQEDDAVDRSYQRCLREVQIQIMAPVSFRESAAWMELAIAAKTLEKIADYAIGIADASIYHTEGVYYWHRSQSTRGQTES